MQPDFISYPFEHHGFDVSRETREKFQRYSEILVKWQKVINLVSSETIDTMLQRHFIDSLQLLKLIPDKNSCLADMGSGAGFPGLVLAVSGMNNVHLIESDVRKATFLREVSRETKTQVTIHDQRVESIKIDSIDFITARALAPLSDLLKMVYQLTSDRPTTCLFLKGEKTNEEIEKAKKKWIFDIEVFDSITDKSGKILKINNLIRK